MVNFEVVIDRSTSLFSDYRLDNLYNINKEAFMTFMRGQLYNSIDDFSTYALSGLSYHIEQEELNDEMVNVYYFDNDLSSKEISILAKGIVINWMTKNILDTEQMNLHLSMKDFKSYSEANNLKIKQETLDKMKEDYGKTISEYQMYHLNKLPFFSNNS